VSRLRLLARDDAPLLARSVYADDGAATPLMRALANAPDQLETLVPFITQTSDPGAVDLATKELVVLRISHLNACPYCLAAHRRLAVESGVGVEEAAALCNEAPLDKLGERERTLVEWVDRYVLDPHAIDDDLVARVLDYFRDDQLIEIALLAGATELLNKFCIAFDVPPA
jgi:AhpD family alkylhydroperoxidase